MTKALEYGGVTNCCFFSCFLRQCPEMLGIMLVTPELKEKTTIYFAMGKRVCVGVGMCLDA